MIPFITKLSRGFVIYIIYIFFRHYSVYHFSGELIAEFGYSASCKEPGCRKAGTTLSGVRFAFCRPLLKAKIFYYLDPYVCTEWLALFVILDMLKLSHLLKLFVLILLTVRYNKGSVATLWSLPRCLYVHLKQIAFDLFTTFFVIYVIILFFWFF